MISFLLVGLLLATRAASSDSELVTSLRAGDQSAFRSIFDRYHVQLHRYLIRRGVEDTAAEDIVQNAFIAIWEKRETLDPSQSVRGYLYRVCHNRAANHFRDRSKFVDMDDARESALVATQETDLSYKELKSAVDRVVSELPDRRRAVFELCFINGLTYREAAAALEISAKTVENQMGHALRTVREHIQHLREA